MADWACAACGAQWAPGAPRCPACPSTEHREVDEVPKILPNGQVTYESDVPREHPGTGVPMEGTEHPADGTMSPPVSNDDGAPYLIDNGGIAGPEGLVVLKAAAEGAAPGVPAQDAAPAPEPAAAPSPPRTPPRRAPASG